MRPEDFGLTVEVEIITPEILKTNPENNVIITE